MSRLYTTDADPSTCMVSDIDRIIMTNHICAHAPHPADPTCSYHDALTAVRDLPAPIVAEFLVRVTLDGGLHDITTLRTVNTPLSDAPADPLLWYTDCDEECRLCSEPCF